MLPNEPGWPAANGRRVVFLLDVVEPARAPHPRGLDRAPPRRRPDRPAYEVATDPAVAPPARCAQDSIRGSRPASPPATIRCWRRCASPGSARSVDGVRAEPARATCSPSAIRAIPGRLRQALILRRHPERCLIVAGEPAPLSELRERWRDAGGADPAHTTGLAEFVWPPGGARARARRAPAARRALQGAAASCARTSSRGPAFRGGVARLARETRPGTRRRSRRARRATCARSPRRTARTSST